MSSVSGVSAPPNSKEDKAGADHAHAGGAAIPITSGKSGAVDPDSPSLLEIGRRAAMQAEREAIERVLTQTRWNRRQAAKILKVSYKALLNKLKLIEEQNAAQNKNLTA
jgi:DNA-binding NtrC family response regulator